MSAPIITVENLSKRYHLGQIGATTLRESAERFLTRVGLRKTTDHRLQTTDSQSLQSAVSGLQSNSDDESELWALKDVSFEVQPGEVLGIIGRNGAGKSTLLKILSRITEPTSGRVIIRGRVASLLEVGTGFHPELSGRENIFLNGAILGMKKAEIARKFDEIVAFSEVERFIDTPVKRYSSGMYVRLAFAVAAHLDPEILIVDEVLAVGDLSFQAKCMNTMQKVAAGGRTVLFVSHNLASIKRLCSRAFLLANASVVASGHPSNVIDTYNSLLSSTSQTPIILDCIFPSNPKMPMQISRIYMLDENERPIRNDQLITDGFSVHIQYQVRTAIQSAYIMCAITNSEGNHVVFTYDGDTEQFGNRRPGEFLATFSISKGLLVAGRYTLHSAVVDTNRSTVHFPGIAFDFTVADVDSLLSHRNIPWPGTVRLNPQWRTACVGSTCDQAQG